ncbi:MAG: anti-phage dCTP deaminase [Fimbriimonadales bacterium]
MNIKKKIITDALIGQVNIEDKDSELVIGLVAPLGANDEAVANLVFDQLQNRYGYHVTWSKLSEVLQGELNLESRDKFKSVYEYYDTYINGGNELREKSEDASLLALRVIELIHRHRKDSAEGRKMRRSAVIVSSIKHPREVEALRRVYGPGFFLIGVHSQPSARLERLKRDKNVADDDARRLIVRDEAEDNPFGQQTRATFELCDAFVWLESDRMARELTTILELLFGNYMVTPTRDELSMFNAYAVSLRSGDLSRQVGAVIVSRDNDVIAIGANEVPRAGGGLYWQDDGYKCRDLELKRDYNARERRRLAIRILSSFNKYITYAKTSAQIEVDDCKAREELVEKFAGWLTDNLDDDELLEETGIMDITEYGRTVHAEMEAILACARCGVTPRGSTLFTVTFPCHNCAKHIVAAGIQRVVYIEPYPKSKAEELHGDALQTWSINEPSKYEDILAGECDDESDFERISRTFALSSQKVIFEPFRGVAPRRFADLFALRTPFGARIKRSTDGCLNDWDHNSAEVKTPVLRFSYIDLEGVVVKLIKEYDQKHIAEPGQSAETAKN